MDVFVFDLLHSMEQYFPFRVYKFVLNRIKLCQIGSITLSIALKESYCQLLLLLDSLEILFSSSPSLKIGKETTLFTGAIKYSSADV